MDNFIRFGFFLGDRLYSGFLVGAVIAMLAYRYFAVRFFGPESASA